MSAQPAVTPKFKFHLILCAMGLTLLFCHNIRAAEGIVFRMPSNLEGEEVKRLGGKITEGVLGLKRGVGVNRERLVVIIDFTPEGKPCRQADFEACLKLSRVLTNLDPSDVQTVGYIHGEVSRFAILPAFACQELVFSKQGFLGPVSDNPNELDANDRARFEETATRMSRPKVVVRRLVDRQTVLVRDPQAKAGQDPYRDGREFAGGEKVLDADAAPTIDRELAQKLGICVPEAIESLQELLGRYALPNSLARAGTLDNAQLGAVQVQLLGNLRGSLAEKLSRDLRRAQALKPGIIVLNLESHAGDLDGAIGLANQLVQVQSAAVKGNTNSGNPNDAPPSANESAEITAWLGSQARDLALLPALACGRMAADDRFILCMEDYLTAKPGDRERLEKNLESLLIDQKWLDPSSASAFAKGLTDPESELVLARPPGGAPRMASPDRLENGWKIDRVLKPKGQWLKITAAQLRDPFRIASTSGGTLDSWYGDQGIATEKVRVLNASGLDELAYFLGHRGTTMFLVTIGLACLMIEILKPGLALPGVISIVCFALVFWANSTISGQIDWLAILLFILGLLMVLVEVFLIPGFGVVGISGLVLMAGGLGLVVYGHWPQSGEEWLGFGQALAPFGLSVLGAVGIVTLFMRNIRHIPWARNLLMDGKDDNFSDPGATGVIDPEKYLAYLGNSGIAITPLRPAGTARFGDDLVDVVSDGGFISPDQKIVVIEVEGNRVVVRSE